MLPGFRQRFPLGGSSTPHPHNKSSLQRGPLGKEKNWPDWMDVLDALGHGGLHGFSNEDEEGTDDAAASSSSKVSSSKVSTGGTCATTAGTVDDLKLNIVCWANAELKYWKNNNLTERRTKGKKRIKKYWKDGVWRTVTLAQARRLAWSAAFIDYVMKKAGASKRFKYAWKHVTYIKAAIDNLVSGNSNPFKAYPVDDAHAAPEPGDLVCNWRKTKRTYDEIKGMKKAHGYTHCDIVVSKDKQAGILTLVGGNKSGGKVGVVTIAIDGNGLVSPNGKYIAVIKVE